MLLNKLDKILKEFEVPILEKKGYEADDIIGTIAKKPLKNIETIILDRNGYLYHGVVATFADALRDAGIKL